MASDTKVTIYYGPLSWFDQQIEGLPCDSLMEIVYARDEVNRQLRVVIPGQQESEPEEQERPEHLVAESGDYASLSRSFPGWRRRRSSATRLREYIATLARCAGLPWPWRPQQPGRQFTTAGTVLVRMTAILRGCQPQERRATGNPFLQTARAHAGRTITASVRHIGQDTAARVRYVGVGRWRSWSRRR